MSNKNDIVTPLEHLPKLNCFKVPEGYFSRLQHNIALRLAVESKPFEDNLSALKNTTAFSLPGNYFDNLSARIAEQTAAKPLLETQPVNSFAVPNGYFDRLYMQIADRISAGARATARPWWQPAPALRPILAFAGVGVVIGLTAWGVFFSQPATHATGLAMATGPRDILIPPIVSHNNNTTPTHWVGQTPQAVKTTVTPNTLTADVSDIFGITGGFGDEMNLSEVPTTADYTGDGLVEILAEDVDITEVINAGL